MSINLHILKASGNLEKFETRIKNILDNQIKKIEEKIQLPSIDIVIDDDASAAISETGIGGSAPSAHLLYIHINPEFNDIENKLDDEIKSTVAHELHHCARWAAIGYGETLLEAIISEGLADHFDIEMNQNKPKPWSIAVHGEELERLKEKAQKEFSNTTYDHNAWFFGTTDIPRWAGYSLGFMLVKQYLEKTGKKASELVQTKADLFIQ